MAQCAAGRWSNNTGLSMECPGACPVAGTYSIATGLTRPEDCEGRLCPGDGNYSPLVGVPTAEKCERLPCPAGRFGASDGLASALDCTPCSTGKTSFGAVTAFGGASRESNGCALCPGGRFNPSTNFTGECTICDAGKTTSSGAPFCFFMCSLGQYWDNVTEVCGTCSPGKSRTLPTSFTTRAHAFSDFRWLSCPSVVRPHNGQVQRIMVARQAPDHDERQVVARVCIVEMWPPSYF